MFAPLNKYHTEHLRWNIRCTDIGPGILWPGTEWPGIFVRVHICPGNPFVRVDRCPGNFVPPDIMPSLQRGSPPFVLNKLSKKIRRKGSHHDIVR